MMRNLLIAVGGVVACALGVAAEPATNGANAAPHPVMIRREVPAPRRTGDTTELELQLVEGLPTVPVMINDHGPYRFAIDTGAGGYLRLSPELASKLQLQPIGEARAADPSGKNPVSVQLYGVQKLKLGDIQFSGVSASGLRLQGRGAELDGVVGIGFFRDLLLTLDYGRGKIIVREGDLPPANGHDIVDIDVQPTGLVLVPVTIGDRTFHAHLDTGNSRQPMFVAEADAKALPVKGEPKPLGVARTVSQEIAIRGLALTVPVRIGNTTLPVSEIAYPAIREPNLGSKALTGMAVTIDLRNRRLRVVPSTEASGGRS